MNYISNNNYILISAAVQKEIEFLKSFLLNPKVSVISNHEVTTGKINNKDVMLVATGPGVVNTAHALTVVIEKLKPALIIQTGCAGAFENSGMTKGDVGIATCEIDIQTGIETEKIDSDIPTPLSFSIISKNDVDIFNNFPTDNKISEKALTILSGNIKIPNKVVYAPFITVSTITATNSRARDIYDAFKPCMESMEGSSAAHISFIYDIPFIEIRSASNIVGKRNKSQWDLPLAFKNSNIAVLEFVNAIGENISLL